MKEVRETTLNVEKILEKNKATRDSDKALLLEYLSEYTSFNSLGEKSINKIAEIIYTEMPSFETITRCRRQIQALGKFQSKVETKQWRMKKAKLMKSMWK
jgi:hypothetical protein